MTGAAPRLFFGFHPAKCITFQGIDYRYRFQDIDYDKYITFFGKYLFIFGDLNFDLSKKLVIFSRDCYGPLIVFPDCRYGACEPVSRGFLKVSTPRKKQNLSPLARDGKVVTHFYAQVNRNIKVTRIKGPKSIFFNFC